MNAPAFLRSLNREIRQQELRRFIRSIAVIEALLVFVVITYCLLAPAAVSNARIVYAATGVFAVLCALLRARAPFARETRLKLALESALMTAFITVVLWFSGGDASPLLGLYLLPITLTALALGRGLALLQVFLVCALYFVLTTATPGAHLSVLGNVGGAIARLTPFLLVAYLTSTLAADILAARQRIESLAQSDPLTGLLNLRTFKERHAEAHATADAQGQPYSLLMVDMDHLKDINDRHGHETGNSAIALVANCIRRTVRASDIAARFGGDEFVVVLPGVDARTAWEIAQRLRHLVLNTTLDVGFDIIHSSISIGMASFPSDGRDAIGLLGLADQRMYRSKQRRRSAGEREREHELDDEQPPARIN